MTKPIPTTRDPDRALGIVRVSTTEQADQDRYSVPHQKVHISEECRHRGANLVHCFEFVQSGAKVMTKGAKERDQVIKYIRDHDISLVVVHELDRLARSVLDTLLFVDELNRLGVTFISIHDGFDTSTAQGQLQMCILSAFAEYFRKQLASKVLGGLTERAKKGLPMGKRPFGRNITPEGFVINEQEAAVIRLMAKLYFEENLGDRSTANRLNIMGYRTQTGGFWGYKGVRDILKSEGNVGTYVWGNIRIENAMPPIFDRETYEKIMARRKLKAQLGGRAQNNKYLLSGLLRCPWCGGSIVGNIQRKGKYEYRYYACTTWRNKGSSVCRGGGFNMEKLEARVLADIENLRRGHKLDLQAEFILSDMEGLQENVRLKQREIGHIKDMSERVALAYEAGEYDLEFYRKRKLALREKEEGLIKEMDGLKAQIENGLSREELKSRLKAKFQNVKGMFRETDIQKTKALLQGFIDHIKVRAVDDITIYYLV